MLCYGLVGKLYMVLGRGRYTLANDHEPQRTRVALSCRPTPGDGLCRVVCSVLLTWIRPSACSRAFKSCIIVASCVLVPATRASLFLHLSTSLRIIYLGFPSCFLFRCFSTCQLLCTLVSSSRYLRLCDTLLIISRCVPESVYFLFFL